MKKGFRFKRKTPVWNKGKKFPTPWLDGVRNSFKPGKDNINYGKLGSNHPVWKEFKKHPFHKTIRESYKYRQWRSDVFSRDDFTCQFCGARGCYLEADHYPKRFIEIINEYDIKTLEESYQCEELWNINNGRTLCRNCHSTTKQGRFVK